MPCSDVTEVVEIRLDAHDRIVSYRLRKRTCGGSLGMPSLIKGWVTGKSVTELIESDPSEFLAAHEPRTITGELVHLKHYVAVRKTCQAIIGQTSDDDIAGLIDSIIYDADGMDVVAIISSEVMSEEIKACAGCGTCGSKHSTHAH